MIRNVLVDTQSGTASPTTTTLNSINLKEATAFGMFTQVTVSAVTGASYKLQYSVDDVTYFDSGVTNNVTATAKFFHEKVDPAFNYVRVVCTVATGSFAYIIQTMVKGM